MSDLGWICIAFAIIMATIMAGATIESNVKERTKQYEIQLKIEMARAGITNNVEFNQPSP